MEVDCLYLRRQPLLILIKKGAAFIRENTLAAYNLSTLEMHRQLSVQLTNLLPPTALGFKKNR